MTENELRQLLYRRAWEARKHQLRRRKQIDLICLALGFLSFAVYLLVYFNPMPASLTTKPCTTGMTLKPGEICYFDAQLPAAVGGNKRRTPSIDPTWTPARPVPARAKVCSDAVTDEWWIVNEGDRCTE